MTCIVGIVRNGEVWIGGDSAGVAGLSLTPRADEKVFRNGPLIMGFTTSFRMGQLLRFSLDPPTHHPDVATNRFMVTDFIDAVRTCLKNGGWATRDNEVEAGGRFLVGYRAKLFMIDSDYQVGEPIDSFAAVGCGSDIALGALHALEKTDCTAKERIEAALDAAARFSAGVCPPFTIIRLKNPPDEGPK